MLSLKHSNLKIYGNQHAPLDFEYFCIDTISIEIRKGIWALSVMLQGLHWTQTAGDLAKYFCCNMGFCKKTHILLFLKRWGLWNNLLHLVEFTLQPCMVSTHFQYFDLRVFEYSWHDATFSSGMLCCVIRLVASASYRTHTFWIGMKSSKAREQLRYYPVLDIGPRIQFFGLLGTFRTFFSKIQFN